MYNDWLGTHKRIKKELEPQKRCVNVNSISKKLNVDIDNIRDHFEVMILDGYGNFMDKEKNIFCTMANSVEVYNYITKNEIKNQINKLR
jgi:hypothetical protein